MNLTDITPSFFEALSAPVAWESKEVGKLLAELAPKLRLQFNWDSGAGIEWMELWGNNPLRSVAVWVNAPLSIVTPQVDAALVQILKLHGAIVVNVPSWSEVAYSIDPQAIRDAATTAKIKHFWHALEEAVSPVAFSIGELVWATE